MGGDEQMNRRLQWPTPKKCINAKQSIVAIFTTLTKVIAKERYPKEPNLPISPTIGNAPSAEQAKKCSSPLDKNTPLFTAPFTESCFQFGFYGLI